MVVDKDEALTEAKQSLEATQKRNKEFDKALKESQDDHQKTKAGLTNMHEENLSLCKEMSKYLKKSFFVAGEAFNNSLQQVKLFFSSVPIPRKKGSPQLDDCRRASGPFG